MRKGIWSIKRSELTPEELEWVRNSAAIRLNNWRRDNKDRLLKKQRNDYKKNRDKLNARRRERYHLEKEYREKTSKRCVQWYFKNRSEITTKLRKQYASDKVYRQKVLSRNKSWLLNNRHKVATYSKNRYHSKLKFDLQYVIGQRLRHQVWSAIKRGGGIKSLPTEVLCGCSIPELMLHLQSKFQEGMHWNNYGKWHIDHIRPCASFDLTDPEQQKQCFHYTNLQPLWAAENIRKGAKVITPHETYA